MKKMPEKDLNWYERANKIYNRLNEYFDIWLQKNKHLLINEDEFTKINKNNKLLTSKDAYSPKKSEFVRKIKK
jgi:hypothetical protein